MRFSQSTDYALRVLMYLGLNDGRLATISEIAATYGISRNHLMKVIHRLGRAGFVHTQRGKGGGIRLARSATEIYVGDVARRMEENWDLVECFRTDGGKCCIRPVCTLRGVLRHGLNTLLRALDEFTVEDLLRHRRSELIELLSPGADEDRAARSKQPGAQ